MIISMIAAISDNGVIGYKNNIPWNCKKDLIYFKKKTLNHHILMGRKTFQSLKKPLLKRKNIVLTTNQSYKNQTNLFFF